MSGPLKIAIVGRPNVGKSTLFNRLVRKKLALVDDTPGVTRDWKEVPANLFGMPLIVIDTAGIDQQDKDDLNQRMWKQTQKGLVRADVILFLMDARAGVTSGDKEVAAWLRKIRKPIILIANKCEGKAGIPGLHESHLLGLGEPIAVSAEHGEGINDLYDALCAFSPQDIKEEELEDLWDETVEPVAVDDIEEEKHLNLVILGRPNVGKSTLINSILNEERLLTGPQAGITRDSISIEWTYQGQPIRLFDTAGIRKQARVNERMERLAVSDSLRSLRYAHVVVLMLDATIALEKQDLTLASRAIEEGRALIIIANKWDLVTHPEKTMHELRNKLDYAFSQARGVPIVTTSAINLRSVDPIMRKVLEVYNLWNTRIPTAQLNKLLVEIIENNPPPLVQGRRIKIKYMTQIKARPPTFVLFTSKASELPESYNRYVINRIRDGFGLHAVPIRLILRSSDNPFVTGKK